MNLNKVSAGMLVMLSLATTALPASANHSHNDKRHKVVNVVEYRNVRNNHKRNKNKFKKVCTTKRIRVRFSARPFKTVKKCKLVRVRR